MASMYTKIKINTYLHLMSMFIDLSKPKLLILEASKYVPMEPMGGEKGYLSTYFSRYSKGDCFGEQLAVFTNSVGKTGWESKGTPPMPPPPANKALQY